jgi:hypothetical protein
MRGLRKQLTRPARWLWRYSREHKVFTRIVLAAVITEIAIGWAYFPGRTPSVSAADVSIDASVNTTSGRHRSTSPRMVFISDQVGYMFYVDFSGDCVYRETTTGGVGANSWGDPTLAATGTVNSGSCIDVAIWYDRWTPGDNTGNTIYIATFTSTDVYFNRMVITGTSTETLDNTTGGVNLTTSKTNSFTNADGRPTITKGTDGVLYIAKSDGTTGNAQIMMGCSATCTSAGNWSDTGTPSLNEDDDPLWLVPLAAGNIMLLRIQETAGDLEYKIWNGSSWGGSWLDIDTSIVTNGLYRTLWSVTVNRVTGDIYTAFIDDATTLGTPTDGGDNIYTYSYDGSSWTQKTDALTNSSDTTGSNNRGVMGVTIAFNENNGSVYVGYRAATTPATDTTANIYWKKSTDGMTTWGPEQGPENTTVDSGIGLWMNVMSNDRIYVVWHEFTNTRFYGARLEDLTPPTITQAAYRMFSSTTAGSNWWNTSWLNRRKITFDAKFTSTDLTDFPVRVSLTGGSTIDYSKTKDAGEDLRFIDADNNTELDYDIDRWTEAGTSEIWVKVPKIAAGSTGDHIWMYYNNTGASAGEDEANTWESTYKMVQHFEETSGTHFDATSNNADSTSVGVTSQGGVTGQIGGADDFELSTTDYVQIAGLAALNFDDNMTLSAWVRPESTPASASMTIMERGSSAVNMGYNFYLRDADLRLWYQTATSANSQPMTVSNSTYTHVAVVVNADQTTFYINGTPAGVRNNTNINLESNASSSTPLYIGSYDGQTLDPFDGRMDELRASSAVRSADWIRAENRTGRNQLNTYGSEESVFTTNYTALAAQDTALLKAPSADPFRLRLLMNIAGDGMQPNLSSYELQYAYKEGTCDASYTGEDYMDVGTGDLKFFDSALSDGDAISGTSTDPTSGSNQNVFQTYEESGTFTNTSRVLSGQAAIWDFSLIDQGHAAGEPYCFRVASSDGTPLSTTPTVIPELQPPALGDVMRHGSFFNNGTEQNAAW